MTTSYYQNLIRNLRLIVKCGICGHRQKLQFHHIKPTKLNGESRGQNKRFRDIVAHPDCYIPLCYFCHQKVTSEKIRLYFEGYHLVFRDSTANLGHRWGAIHVI